MQLFGVDHHNYSFLGWTIPSNVRKSYAFNAAQDKATQKNPLRNDFLSIRQQSPPATTSSLWREAAFAFLECLKIHISNLLQIQLFHTELKIWFIQLSFFRPSFSSQIFLISMKTWASQTLYSCRRHKNTLGGGVIPTCQDIKSGIKDAILKDQ